MWPLCHDGEQHKAWSSGTAHVIRAQTSALRRYTRVYSAKTLQQPQGLLQDAFKSPLLLGHCGGKCQGWILDPGSTCG